MGLFSKPHTYYFRDSEYTGIGVNPWTIPKALAIPKKVLERKKPLVASNLTENLFGEMVSYPASSTEPATTPDVNQPPNLSDKNQLSLLLSPKFTPLTIPQELFDIYRKMTEEESKTEFDLSVATPVVASVTPNHTFAFNVSSALSVIQESMLKGYDSLKRVISQKWSVLESSVNSYIASEKKLSKYAIHLGLTGLACIISSSTSRYENLQKTTTSSMQTVTQKQHTPQSPAQVPSSPYVEHAVPLLSYQLKSGDNAWTIIKNHYGLTDPKIIADSVNAVMNRSKRSYPQYASQYNSDTKTRTSQGSDGVYGDHLEVGTPIALATPLSNVKHTTPSYALPRANSLQRTVSSHMSLQKNSSELQSFNDFSNHVSNTSIDQIVSDLSFGTGYDDIPSPKLTWKQILAFDHDERAGFYSDLLLYKKHNTVKDTAKNYGVSVSTIYRWKKQLAQQYA